MIPRSALLFFATLSLYLSNLQVLAFDTSGDSCFGSIDQELGAKLSSQASIVHYSSAAPRWSEYHSPKPGTIVNVAEENDVVETVKYCIKNNLDFLAQSGGHGWATTFNIGEKDVLINMRGLNKVHVNHSKDKITFGGGALVSEVVDEAYQNGVQVVTASCNCIGMLGAVLGGGLSRLMGRYGLGVDNLLSVNLVTADGKLITVTPASEPDLWWALRGAGANFGIVTSATMKAHPAVNNGMAWIGNLVFTPDKLEVVVQTISDLDFKKEMSMFLFFTASPPDYAPLIVAEVFYSGTETEGKAAWKALYDIGPIEDTTGVVPYDHLNDGTTGFCAKGDRKFGYTAGLKKMDPKVFREIWNEWTSLISSSDDLKQVYFLIECYSYKTVRKFAESSSAYPHRRVNFHAIVLAWYSDAKLDFAAENFGRKIRKLWFKSSGFAEDRAYINFAHGDEDLKTIYGESLSRLKKVKKSWDKNDRFSQFLPISR